jgi:hypothetical protein
MVAVHADYSRQESHILDIVRTTSENQPYDARLHRARHRSSAVRESALKQIDAAREIRPFLAWPVDLISADPHALIVFRLEQANWHFGVA